MQKISKVLAPKKLAFVAGRSGGHVLPALTLAQQSNTNVLFFSTDTALDKKLLTGQNVVCIPLTLQNIPRKKVYKFPHFIWQFTRSFCISLRQLRTHKPTTVISTGGYVSIPVCLAAKLLRIPIELYELNIIPGKATKFLAPLADTIHICFEQTKQYLPAHTCTVAPYPLRFTEQDKQADKTAILQQLGFSPNKKTIVILGGSQGSLFINNTIKQALENNKKLHNNIQIIHQTGSHDPFNWPAFYKKNHISAIAFDYQDDIKKYYIAADLIVCRAGAGTLFEIAFFEKKCITIPLETATTAHQVDNAQAMAKRYPQLFTVVRQQELHDTPDLMCQYF